MKRSIGIPIDLLVVVPRTRGGGSSGNNCEKLTTAVVPCTRGGDFRFPENFRGTIGRSRARGGDELARSLGIPRDLCTCLPQRTAARQPQSQRSTATFGAAPAHRGTRTAGGVAAAEPWDGTRLCVQNRVGWAAAQGERLARDASGTCTTVTRTGTQSAPLRGDERAVPWMQDLGAHATTARVVRLWSRKAKRPREKTCGKSISRAPFPN